MAGLLGDDLYQKIVERPSITSLYRITVTMVTLLHLIWQPAMLLLLIKSWQTCFA